MCVFLPGNTVPLITKYGIMKTTIIPTLPYAQDHLEPVMSKDQVHYHFDVHTKKYFDKTNELIKGTLLEGLSLEELNSRIQKNPSRYKTKLVHNVSQAWNHQFFWNQLGASKDTKPHELIISHLADLKQQVAEKASEVFGSGWVWIVKDGDKFSVVSTPNGEQPKQTKIIAFDVWEHAFYVDYPADKDSYITKFWEIVDWNKVNERIAD